MGFLRKLFGTIRRPDKPYVDGGMRLLHRLITSLRLNGWENLLPVYTPREIEVIEQKLAQFQSAANDVAGGPVVFHPEAVAPIQRSQTAQALADLAGEGWRFSDKSELPKDWAARVSTYLKAWACGLDPNCLQQIGEMLAQAGCKTEAREAFEVVLLFPTYAHAYFGGAQNTSELTNMIVQDARKAIERL